MAIWIEVAYRRCELARNWRYPEVSVVRERTMICTNCGAETNVLAAGRDTPDHRAVYSIAERVIDLAGPVGGIN